MDAYSFRRLAEDRTRTYGDGGYLFLEYPVWVCEDLVVDCRERLLEGLNALNEERQDHHAYPSPVEDIIDPDLLLCRPGEFDGKGWIKEQVSMAKADNRRYDEADDVDKDEHVQLRSTYRWMPTEFRIGTDNSVKIITQISQLERTGKNQQLYKDIAQVFQAMLPAFQKSEIVGLKAEAGNTLQVIIKAQSYNVKSGMKYSGRWHSEGHTENIIAAGVYYVHFDEQLEGGHLKFRPKEAPCSEFRVGTDAEVAVGTGACVVFSNSLPHRVRQIRNLTENDGLRRTFLNFFIVDPQKPISIDVFASRVLAPLDIIVSILAEVSEGCLMIGPILDNIVEKLGPSAWQNIEEAKAFRTRVREAMTLNHSGWGWVEYGNSGEVTFVKSRCLYSKKESTYKITHTDSDNAQSWFTKVDESENDLWDD